MEQRNNATRPPTPRENPTGTCYYVGILYVSGLSGGTIGESAGGLTGPFTTNTHTHRTMSYIRDIIIITQAWITSMLHFILYMYAYIGKCHRTMSWRIAYNKIRCGTKRFQYVPIPTGVEIISSLHCNTYHPLQTYVNGY